MPDNCYLLKVGTQKYYRYKNTLTKKFHMLGKERSEAFRAARILNARLLSTPTSESFVASVLTPRTPVGEYVKRFRDVILPARRSRKGKPLSVGTMKGYKEQLTRIERDLGSNDLARISRRDITVFLDGFKPFARNRMRSLVNDLFSNAVAEGHRDDNPVAGTLKAD